MATAKTIEELQKDINDLNRLMGKSLRPNNNERLQAEHKKLKTEMIRLQERDIAMSALSHEGAAARYAHDITTYSFEQSDYFVKIFITLDGVHEACQPDDVTVQFTDHTVLLQVANLNGKDYKLLLTHLQEPIDGARSFYKIKRNLVAVYAKKQKDGIVWQSLTAIDEKLDAIDRAKNHFETEEGEDELSDDPKVRHRKFMRAIAKIYQQGDAEMRQKLEKGCAAAADRIQRGLWDDDE